MLWLYEVRFLDLRCIGEGSVIAYGANLVPHELVPGLQFVRGPLTIGVGCRVGEGARVSCNCAVAEGAKVPAQLGMLAGEKLHGRKR